MYNIHTIYYFANYVRIYTYLNVYRMCRMCRICIIFVKDYFSIIINIKTFPHAEEKFQ